MHCAVDELRLLDSKDIEKMLKTGQMREDEFFKSSVSHVFVIVLQILISVDFSMDSVHLLLNRFTQRMIYREFYWTFYIQMIQKYNLVNSTFLEDQIKKLLLDEKQKYCYCWIDICVLNPKILDELVVEGEGELEFLEAGIQFDFDRLVINCDHLQHFLHVVDEVFEIVIFLNDLIYGKGDPRDRLASQIESLLIFLGNEVGDLEKIGDAVF